MAVTWYSLFKGLHVLAAVTWVGGALFASILGARIARSNDGPRMAAFSGDMEVIGMRLFVPASFVLLLTGTGMLLNAGLSWSQLWVGFGLLVWLVGLVLGLGYFGPQTGRLKTLIEEQGPEAPEVQARIREILTVSRLELVLLLAVVWDMTVKPGREHVWWVVAAVVVIGAALALAARPLLAREG